MLLQSLVLAFAALVAADNTKTLSTTSSKSTSTSNAIEPCAKVSSILAKDPEATEVPAQTAFDCLNSVPVDVDGNSKLIDELKTVWQWQSEYGWLKNTPKEWELGPLDISSELKKIQDNLKNYKSEYEVQIAIQNITTRTGNYHFNYDPDILGVFSYQRGVSVVAISENGKTLPKLWSGDDVDAARLSEDKNLKISDITEINGQNAFDYLDKLAAWEQYLDHDGGVNKLMYKGDTGTYGNFAYPTQYDGPVTNFTFANQTKASYDNTAVVTNSTMYSFKRVKDGKSFFKAYCTGATIDTSARKAKRNIPKPRDGYPKIPDFDSSSLQRRQIPVDSSEPKAVVIAKSAAVAGYFLKGKGYDDIAVLKIITFDPEEDSSGKEFQKTIRSFLQKCTDEKKQKLIIDLRENGGGSTHLLLDAFMQLFPELEPFSGQRYRATEQFKLIGDGANEIRNNKDMNASFVKSRDDTLIDDYYGIWVPQHFRTAQGNNFKDWNDFYGPQMFNSDNFTKVMRYNYSNADSYVRPNDFSFTDTSKIKSVFNASNVIMFTDALCGSSCASFHEELKNVAGVKAVTVGGRARKGTIQTITGTKGGEVYPLTDFPDYASTLLNASSSLKLTSVKPDNQDLQTLANVPQMQKRLGPSGGRLQVQDQIRKGDESATPLQYIYEASDCRIFYTMDTYASMENAWKQAWDAMQNDTKCVDGSTKHASSISGGYKPYGGDKVKNADLPSPSSSKPASSATASPSGTSIPKASPSPSGKGQGSSASMLQVKSNSVLVGIVAGVLLTL